MIHGQKKADKVKSEEQQKEENELANKISNKLAEFFAIRNKPVTSDKIPTLLQFTSILMQLCPDITTIFNFRRELIERCLKERPAEQAAILGDDLKLITKIIKQDPKSYTLWSYRQWLVLKLEGIKCSVAEKEKELCTLLLGKDEKNFHVWNYRNWVNSISMNIDTELQFTKVKINSNPFNFSPYHFRSKYLTEKYARTFREIESKKQQQQIIQFGMPKSVYDEQLSTARTAIFLNPSEEAPWLYYSWLMKQIIPALLLKVQQANDKGRFTLLFSQKVACPKSLIITEKQYTVQSTNSISSQWELVFVNAEDESLIECRSNDGDIKEYAEVGSRWIIGTQKSSTEEIKRILEGQQKFVIQVIESEEGACRFASLQLVEIQKSKLYLGVNAIEWEKIAYRALAILLGLGSAGKGQKYIQKQVEDWERLRVAKNLTAIEAGLREYEVC